MTTFAFVTLLILCGAGIIGFLFMGFWCKKNYTGNDVHVLYFFIAVLLIISWILIFIGNDSTELKLNDYESVEHNYILLERSCFVGLHTDVVCKIKLSKYQAEMDEIKSKLGVK